MIEVSMTAPGLASNLALVKELTLAQMKARYRRTWAGFLWVVLNPIIMFSVQALVFKNVLRVGVPNYGLFLLGGLLPWIFIVTSLEMGIPVLVSSRDLMNAFHVPPFVLVLSSLIDNWINFLAALILILVPTLLVSGGSAAGLPFLPVAGAITFLGVAGLLWFLSVLNVFYRDTRFVVHFLISVLFFTTPVFYPPEFVPPELQWLILMNPIYALIEPVRSCVLFVSLERVLVALSRGAAVTAIWVPLSYLYWKKRQNDFYYYL